MKHLVLIFLVALAACNNTGNTSPQPPDTTGIGVDSTRLGADSGILRKLP